MASGEETPPPKKKRIKEKETYLSGVAHTYTLGSAVSDPGYGKKDGTITTTAITAAMALSIEV